MSKQGSFRINWSHYYHRGVMFCPMIYYRYLQRSRLKKWIVGFINKRWGVRAPPKVRYAMIHSDRFNNYRTRKFRKKHLKRVYPKAGRRGRTRLAWRSRKVRGWVDIEMPKYISRQKRRWNTRNWNIREIVRNINSRVEFRAYNVTDFVEILNPMKGLRHYKRQGFGSIIYQADSYCVIYIAARICWGNILAHTIVMGIERHAGRKKQQRRFINMIWSITRRMRWWESIMSEPRWRISVYGKIDAKMRRVHNIIRVGFIRYQEIDFRTNYNSVVSRTKYGTSSVRVWMNNSF